MMPISSQCQTGCTSFDGGEVRHRRDCVHYPESLTKVWHDTEAEYVAEIERLRQALTRISLAAQNTGTRASDLRAEEVRRKEETE